MQENGFNPKARPPVRFGWATVLTTPDRRDGQQTVKEASILFKAVKPKGGEMPVCWARQVRLFLHEAIGQPSRPTSTEEPSIFRQAAQKVCGDFINVVDDGTVHSTAAR
jgi:predicted Zn-dependent protease